MITREQFLRRSLLAPIAVPMIIEASHYIQSVIQRTPAGVSASELTLLLRYILLCTMGQYGQTLITCIPVAVFLFCFIPYIGMLWIKREELYDTKTGKQLENDLMSLPFKTILYVLIVAIVPASAVWFVNPNLTGPCFWLLIFGIFATVIVGCLYVAITMCFLRVFQGLNLITE